MAVADEKAENKTNDVENAVLSGTQTSNTTHRSCLCKCCIITGICCTILCVLAFLLIFVGVPVAIMSSIDIQRNLIFVPYDTPREVFLSISDNVNGSRNLYITVNKLENITLGAWHFLPEPLLNDSLENKNFSFKRSLAKPDYPVLLHFHGNGGSRWNNLDTYLKLRQYFHVVAFDYRGYGDSSKAELTEEGIVEDSMAVYKWLKARTVPDNVYVWGHSLGSALATHTLARLKNENILPMGLILEAPFTNLREATENFYLSKIISWLPWFAVTVLDGLEKNRFYFKTSENILNVDCPVLILHAKDDILIPYRLGEKLAKIAQEKRNPTTQGKVLFHLFPAELAYNHWGIPDAPDLYEYLRAFMNTCEEYNEKAKRNTTKNRH